VPASPTHPAEASARVQARAGSSVPAASAGWHGSHRRLAGIAVTTVAAAVLAAVMTVVFTQHPAARTDNPARTGRPVTVQSTPARNARAPIPANSASGPSRAAPSRPRARDRHHLAEEGSMTWTG
jgi:hypothetical protein